MHYGHEAIIRLKDRSLFVLQEMNDVLLRHCNDMESIDDSVYILGNISHHLFEEKTEAFIRRMNGRKILLCGSHDKGYAPSLFKEITDFKLIHAEDIAFTLLHDSMLLWPGSARGSIQFHGHIHALPDYNLKN